MNMLIPKQHGAWAMLVIPYVLGMVKGGVVWWHLPLAVGWLFLYLVAYPLTMLVKKRQMDVYKKWAVRYGVVAACFLLPVVWMYPPLLLLGSLLFPLFLVMMMYARKNDDRAFLNDLVAVVIFSAAGLASYWLGAERLDEWALFIFGQTMLFFVGSAFYVKSMIREKNNRWFARYSWVYHVLAPCLSLAMGAGWAVLALIPSSIRAWVLYGKKLSIMRIGIYEVINASFFLLVISSFLLW
ncbi:YwiC-like family protein [Halalkalibacterium halodurans]|uniref:YwiC-like protein n=2 Tax=Halalkalibacterium halodurans TaxID=86665 RepID=A0A0M0KDG6_ALKHA|nr:YwiC-like family protein [Halalkalibacterium halodurans]MDY7220741.1 YwiC-like family protein [Halalkalibacterium halodurans]MDY7239980.1 YwiC-like family protein [Halalkalibacterium halodurans]MED4164313.1 YwiC-like family protein [Halalkalibacterium halodurans]TPE67373.1 hypothetical protein AMD02_017295 [Halalkalibacterium halodurans]